MQIKNEFYFRGQTLIEVMVAMTVGVLVLTAITSSVLTSLVNSRISTSSNEAAQYAQEGIEIARLSRTAASGTYCLDKGVSKLSGIPQGTCPTANISGKYIRTVEVQPGTAADCGVDVNKTVVTVKWTDAKCTNGAFCHKTVLSSCMNVIALAGTVTPTGPAPGTPTATVNAPTLSTMTIGNSSTFTWTSTNAVSCTASNAWSGTKSASGQITVTPTSTGTYTYTLVCTSSLGVDSAPSSRTITVNPLPTASLNGTSPIYAGGSTTLSWSSTYATSCTDDGWTASSSSSGSQIVSPVTTTMYNIYCTSSDGYQSGNASKTITVLPVVTHDSSNTAPGPTTTTSLSWAHTTSGTNRLLVVGIVTKLNSVTGVTYNGVAMTKLSLSTGSSGNGYAWLYTLVNPASGTHNIVVSLASDYIIAGSMSFYNVHQTTPLGTGKVINTWNGTAATTITTPLITSADEEKIVDVMMGQNYNGTATPGSGQTQKWYRASGSTTLPSGGGSYKTGAASTTTSWTWPTAQRGIIIAVPIKAAP